MREGKGPHPDFNPDLLGRGFIISAVQFQIWISSIFLGQQHEFLCLISCSFSLASGVLGELGRPSSGYTAPVAPLGTEDFGCLYKHRPWTLFLPLSIPSSSFPFQCMTKLNPFLLRKRMYALMLFQLKTMISLHPLPSWYFCGFPETQARSGKRKHPCRGRLYPSVVVSPPLLLFRDGGRKFEKGLRDYYWNDSRIGSGFHIKINYNWLKCMGVGRQCLGSQNNDVSMTIII